MKMFCAITKSQLLKLSKGTEVYIKHHTQKCEALKFGNIVITAKFAGSKKELVKQSNDWLVSLEPSAASCSIVTKIEFL